MQRAKQVPDKAADELIHAVEQGKVAVSLAAMLSNEKPETQEAVVRKLESGEAKRPMEAWRLRAHQARHPPNMLGLLYLRRGSFASSSMNCPRSRECVR